MNKFINNGAKTPPINRLPMSIFFNNLRSQILRRSTDRKSFIFSDNVVFRKSKICQLNVAFFVNEYIFWFEVSIYDVLRVEVFDGEDHLGGVESGLRLGEALLFAE